MSSNLHNTMQCCTHHSSNLKKTIHYARARRRTVDATVDFEAATITVYSAREIRANVPDRRIDKTKHKSCYTERRIRVIDISTPFTRAYAAGDSIWPPTVKCARHKSMWPTRRVGLRRERAPLLEPIARPTILSY